MITEDDARGPYSIQYVPPFRVGLVTAQQITPFPAARVKFPDRDSVVSYWLPISLPKVQNDKFFWMPDVGEQVLVLMDEHDENGAVVGSLGSTVDTAPSWATANTFGVQFSDGTIVRYDRAAHVLTAQLGTGGSATISTPLGNTVVLGSDGTTLLTDQIGASVKLSNDGNVRVNGNLLVSGTIGTFSGTFGNGDMTITGTIKATGDVTASTAGNNISVTGHVHSGVQTGGGDTAAPVANT